jgi:hypothetical protein
MPWIKTALVLSMLALVACDARDDAEPGTAEQLVDEEKPGPAPVVVSCVAGERYVCDCGDGNRGNKFCAWTGDAFSECMLCGVGAEYIEDTGIPCDTNPTAGTAPVPCPDMVGCVGLVCYDKSCHLATALPATILTDTAGDDCAQRMCDGSGNAVTVPDPRDCNGTCNDAGACVISQ